MCGASRHGFEVAKVGNRLLVFRVTAIAACLRPTQNGHIVPHNLTRKGPREFVPPGSFFVFPSGIRPGLAGVFQLSAPFLEVSGRGGGGYGRAPKSVAQMQGFRWHENTAHIEPARAGAQAPALFFSMVCAAVCLPAWGSGPPHKIFGLRGKWSHAKILRKTGGRYRRECNG